MNEMQSVSDHSLSSRAEDKSDRADGLARAHSSLLLNLLHVPAPILSINYRRLRHWIAKWNKWNTLETRLAVLFPNVSIVARPRLNAPCPYLEVFPFGAAKDKERFGLWNAPSTFAELG